jgi:predicted Zn-dependent peptidase
VAGEKVNLINAIMAQINDKRTYASIRLRQEMFRGERYGVGKYGTQEQVEAITPERLYAHYQTILETSQIELTFAGQTDIDVLKVALLEALKSLPRGALVRPETTEGPMPETVRELSETMDVTQGKLVMGFRTGITAADENYPALLLMNSVYGGSLTSKLFMNVREKLSLCYYASSGLDRFKGVMIVSSGVDMDKVETAKAEILAQLEACRRGEIAQEELEPARSYLISSLKAGEDSAYGMEDFYVGQTIGGYTYTPDTLAQALQKVTIPEIQAVANRLKLDTIYFLKGAE